MSEFGYKVVLEADECSAKRFSVFHSEKEMSDYDAGIEACNHLSSQTCPRCGSNHGPNDYFPISVEVSLH